MSRPDPSPARSAIRTGHVLERPVPIIELSSLARAERYALNDRDANDRDARNDDVQEVSADDVLDDEPVRTPPPPVIPSIRRTAHGEPPPPVSRTEAARARRGTSFWAMLATVVLLGGLGALAGFAMRSLARAPSIGASSLLPSAAVIAPGDREQRWRAAPRVSVDAPPAPPALGSPPPPVAVASPPVVQRVSPAHANPARPNAPHVAYAAHGAHATRAPVKPAAGSRAPQTKKKAKN